MIVCEVFLSDEAVEDGGDGGIYRTARSRTSLPLALVWDAIMCGPWWWGTLGIAARLGWWESWWSLV
jgi:hypothetical protein